MWRILARNFSELTVQSHVSFDFCCTVAKFFVKVSLI